MKTNSSYKQSDLEILEKNFLNISDKSVREYDISKVRGSVRIRTAEIITKDEVSKLKSVIRSLKFPSEK